MKIKKQVINDYFLIENLYKIFKIASEARKKAKKKRFILSLTSKRFPIIGDSIYVGEGLRLPQNIVKQLRNKPSITILIQLQSCLALSNSWYQNFVQYKGILSK